jgi:hypothetical protein
VIACRVMSPIQSGNWGPPRASLGDFPKLFDHWAQPRSTPSLHRLSANCQSTLELDSPTVRSPSARPRRRARPRRQSCSQSCEAAQLQRLAPHGFPQSTCSEPMGSTEAARQAGTRQAATLATRTRTGARVSATRSAGETPVRNDRMIRPVTTAPMSPARSPLLVDAPDGSR